MKKILILMVLMSTFLLAKKGYDDILEERIENELKINRNITQLSKYKVDYDVDVYGNQMNLEIELEGMREPKLNYDDIASKVVTMSRRLAPEIEDIYVVIKFDSKMANDKIVFSKIYSN